MYTLVYDKAMKQFKKTDTFTHWLCNLRDIQARARIEARIVRAEMGNFGDCKPIGDGVSEMRIHWGAGYRVYFVQRGQTLVVLLAGGDKSTQAKDIKTALQLARET
jgi:putative addiction module killer protein